MATRSSSGVMSAKSSPIPWASKSFHFSSNTDRSASFVSEKVMENGPPQPRILPASSSLEPTASPRLIRSRTTMEGGKTP